VDSGKPTQISLGAPEEAPGVIKRLRGGAPWPWLLGVTGPQGAGKTTVAAMIARDLGGVILPTDSYLPDYSVIPPEEVDDPMHADLPLLAEHLQRLASGETIDKPVWSFYEHRRVGSEPFGPARVVVCEGIHALHDLLRPKLHLTVYVEAKKDARWLRVAGREISGERGWGVERAQVHFEGVAEPTFDRYASGYRANADILVRNDSPLRDEAPKAGGQQA